MSGISHSGVPHSGNYAQKVKDEMRNSLQTYMDAQGIKFKGEGRGSFGCPNSSFHSNGDRNFSGTFKTGTNGQMWVCHRCKSGGDIYNMANFVEGLPIGQTVELWTITVPSVANTISYPIDQERYFDALKDLHVDPKKVRSHLNKDYITEVNKVIKSRKNPAKINIDYNRNYTEQIRNAISEEFDIFFPETGDFNFLPEQHPLNDDNVIRTGSLAFPIHNQYGILIGMMSRRTTADINEGSRKYLYTSSFIEGEQLGLFNFHRARRDIQASRVVYCFEAQFDCMAAYVSGMKNSVSIGTSSNLEALVRGLKSCAAAEVVLVMDNDPAGHSGTVRVAEYLIENGFGVSVFLLPEGKDADEYIMESGIDVLKDLSKRISIIEYILHVNYENLSNPNLSPNVKYMAALQYICQFSRNVGIAVTYAPLLSQKFGIRSSEDVRYDIVRDMSQKKDPVAIQYNDLVSDTFKKIADEPDIEKKFDLYEQAGRNLRDIGQSYAVHNRTEESRELDEILVQGQDDRARIYTGIQTFDDAVRMTLGTLMIIGARPSVGKSTLIRGMVPLILDKDPNTFIIHASLDDTRRDTMDGIISTLSGIENTILESGDIDEELMPRIAEAQKRVRSWWGNQYYMVGQGKIISVDDLRAQIRRVQMRDETKKILLIVDNFMNLPSVSSTGVQNKRTIVEQEMSKLHILTQSTDIACICMVELTKSGPYRPNLTMLKETGSIEYRAKIVAMMHNDLKANPDSKIYWNQGNRKMPVLEIDFPKYKVGEPNQKVLLCMDPALNQFQEATEAQSKKWQQIIATAVANEGKAKGKGPGRSGEGGEGDLQDA